MMEVDSMNRIFRPLILVTILVFSVLFLPVSGISQASRQIASSGEVTYTLSWLHTDGKLIRDQTGKTVRLMGCGIEEPCWDKSGLQNEEIYRLIASYGANHVRVMFNKAWVSDPQYLAVLDNIVAWCKKYHLWVMPCFAVDGTTSTWTEQAVIAAIRNSTWIEGWIQMWEALAQHWKNESTVMGFAIFNEPYLPSGLKTWWDAALACIQRIHAVNPNVLCFVGSPDYQKDFRWFFMDGGYGVFSEPNVVYAWHRYYHYDLIYEPADAYCFDYRDGNFTTAKQKYEQTLYNCNIKLQDVANVPVMFEEFGEGTSYIPSDPNWNVWLQDTYDILKNYGVSANQYAWYWMTTNRTVLNQIGQIWAQNMP